MAIAARIAGTLVTGLLLAMPHPAESAEGAYAVDKAQVDEPGSCKVEAWTSFSSRNDFAGAVAPACAVSIGRPVEFGAQFDRVKIDGEWASGLLLKTKTSIVPLTESDARFGIAISGASVVGLESGKVAAWILNVPFSFRATDAFQINAQFGGLWNRVENRTHFTWGLGFEWSMSEPFMLIGEVFSIAARTAGAQIGLRYTPHEKIDFDFIYGRNLAGEQADWITLGVNLRF